MCTGPPRRRSGRPPRRSAARSPARCRSGGRSRTPACSWPTSTGRSWRPAFSASRASRARGGADGALELFGRNDRQVKLRGQRIELPEIEAVLQAQAEVAQAAVVLVGDPQGDGELRAFIRPVTPACPPQLELLWQHLRAHLPSGALPSRLMVLREFPVSPNGKLDYTALRSMEVSAAAPGAGQAPPGAPDADPELSKRLLSLLRAALGRPTMSDRDHFFLNGGHSLLAAQLATRIAETEGLDVPLRMIFDHPTARQLSGQLTGERG